MIDLVGGLQLTTGNDSVRLRHLCLSDHAGYGTLREGHVRVQMDNSVLGIDRYFVEPTYLLGDVCMVLSLESGAGQPRLSSAGIARLLRTPRRVGLSQPGGALPDPGYYLLQGLASLHSDGGGCNATRPTMVDFAFKCEWLAESRSFVLDWLYWLWYFREKDI